MAKKIDFEIKEILHMRDYLALRGKEADFSSAVYHIVLNNDSEWVLKPLNNSSDLYEVETVIGEVAAYKLSKKICNGLVPKTKLVTYDNHLGSLQEFIKDTRDKKDYPTLLLAKTLEVQSLKLFWFILGQWDTADDNVFFTSNGKPVAIDNANIANIQKVNIYGQFPFIQTFKTDSDNLGSLESPQIIEDLSSKVLIELKYKFDNDLPEDISEKLTTNLDKWTKFIYFVENGVVYRNFYIWDEQPGYFMEEFSLQALEPFANIMDGNSLEVFEKLIDKSLESLNGKIIHDKLKANKDIAKAKLIDHFKNIVEGMQTRYELAEKYLNEQIELKGYMGADQFIPTHSPSTNSIESYETKVFGEVQNNS